MDDDINALLESSHDTLSELNNIYQNGEWVVVELESIGSFTNSDSLISSDRKGDNPARVSNGFGRETSFQPLSSDSLGRDIEGMPILKMQEIPTTMLDFSSPGSINSREDKIQKDSQPFSIAVNSATVSSERGAVPTRLSLFLPKKESPTKAIAPDPLPQGSTSLNDKDQDDATDIHGEVSDTHNQTLPMLVDEARFPSVDKPPQATPDGDAGKAVTPQEGDRKAKRMARIPCPKPKFPTIKALHNQSGAPKEKEAGTSKGCESLNSAFGSNLTNGARLVKGKNTITMLMRRRTNFDSPVILRCVEGKGKPVGRVTTKARSLLLEPIMVSSEPSASNSNIQLVDNSKVSSATPVRANSGRLFMQTNPDRSRYRNFLKHPKTTLVWAPNSIAEGLKSSVLVRGALSPTPTHPRQGWAIHPHILNTVAFLRDSHNHIKIPKSLFLKEEPTNPAASRFRDISLNSEVSRAPRGPNTPHKDRQGAAEEGRAGENLDSVPLPSDKPSEAEANSVPKENAVHTGGRSPTSRDETIPFAIEALRAIYESLHAKEVLEARGVEGIASSPLKRIEDFLSQHEMQMRTATFDGSTTIHSVVLPLETDEFSDLSRSKAEEISNVDEFDELTFSKDPYPTPKVNFNYGKPTVFGRTTPFFEEGGLYKIITGSQKYYFFNDTIDSVMLVRAQCTLSEEDCVNEQAVITPLENNADGTDGDHPRTTNARETEIAISVLPEQTVFLLSTQGCAPRFLAKAIPAPESVVPPSMVRFLDAVNKDISRVRELLDRWSCITNQEAYLKCCLKNQIGFVDLDFKPSAESLSRAGVDSLRLPALVWQRPGDYLALSELAEVRLFRGRISPFLVRPGLLGDAAVWAGIAAIAHRPRHVRWLFRHPVSPERGRKERAVGCYRVRLLHDGWWAERVVDDFLPASCAGPLFARCPADPRRVWVGLLEKTCAKAAGSFAAACAADVRDVWTALTGFPARALAEAWRADAAAGLFDHLAWRLSRGDLILFFRAPGGLAGFLPSQVAFLTGCVSFPGLPLRAVRLRRAWAREAPPAPTHADWSPEFDRDGRESEGGGTPVEETAPGVSFWLWEEALREFTGGVVCYALWDFAQYRLRNYFTPQGLPAFALEVQIVVEVDIFLMLTLEGHKHAITNTTEAREEGNNAAAIHEAGSLDGITLLITRRAGRDGMDSVFCRASSELSGGVESSVFGSSRNLCVEVKLEPGCSPYYIIPRLDPKRNGALPRGHLPGEHLKFVLSILSSRPVHPGVFDVSFQEIPSSCEVFCENPQPSFRVNPCRVVKTTYQCPSESGVDTMERTCIIPPNY